MDEKRDETEEVKRLRSSAAALETQRTVLGDEAVDTALAAIQMQIKALESSEQLSVEDSDLPGDEIDVGDIEGLGIAIGREAKAEVQAHIINVYQQVHGRPQLDQAAFSEALDRYLEWVDDRYGRLNLRGVERREQKILSLSLDEVYVSLEAELSPDRKVERGQARGRPEPDEFEAKGGMATVDMSQLLTLSPRLVITGGPGSGKTTFLQIIASSLARALRSGDTAAVQQYLGLEGELPLPILVPLSDYNRYRRGVRPTDEARKGTLAAFISHCLIREQAAIGLPEDFFERLLVQGHNCILLLDGLDEVANERERLLVRMAVQNLARNRGVGRLLVTSRSRAYQGEAVLPESFRPCSVRPLSPEQVDALAARWCAAVYDEGEIARETADLQGTIHGLEALRQSRGEARLVDSPLLVTIVAIVHYNEQRRLPAQRAELYERCVDALLAEKHKAPSDAIFELVDWGGKVPEKRALLAFLAYQMMSAGEESGRSVDERRLKEWLRPRFVRLRGEAEAETALELFVQAMRERGSLLDERGGRYSYLHLTFQEYLCAYHLAETVREVDKIVAFLAEEERVAQAWWRETILLVGGYLGVKSEETALAFADKLAGLELDGAGALAAAELAGTALLELDTKDEATRGSVSQRLADLLTDPELVAANELRALAGRALGWLSDPREDVTCEVPCMIEVPAGPFLMGSDKSRDENADDDEQPEHDVTLATYHIGKYPATVAQYRRFVEAGGYRERRFWTETGWGWRQEEKVTEPYLWEYLQWTVPNHPVVGVSWYEAVAYCAWLSETTGRSFRLPDEAMWEKAARGGDGRIYPWGDDWDPARLNSGADKIATTSAVGIFLNGRSPYRLYDCSGNVLEWCSGLGYSEMRYPFIQQSYKEELEQPGSRALRGGAFDYLQGYARATFRDMESPNIRDYYIGFRVVESLSEG